MKSAFKKLILFILVSAPIVIVGNILGATMLLEYLKVLCTWPVAFFAAVLLVISVFREPISVWLTYLKIDYGGMSVYTSQAVKAAAEEVSSTQIKGGNVPEPAKQETLPDDIAKLKEFVEQWRAAAHIWEYRYLNYYLVRNTQIVLDWLYDVNKPINLEVADGYWRTLIPRQEERLAILEALKQHYLAIATATDIQITPKGREYVEQRGRVTPAPGEVSKK